MTSRHRMSYQNNFFIYKLEMKKLLFTIFLLVFMSSFSCLFAQELKMDLQVDANIVTHQMKGGIGASWHTLIHEMPFDNSKYDYPARFVGPRGSAYAGNPPLTDTIAWNQLYYHAKWLGLNFVRVELAQHIYEPDRNVFDWKNDEMQSLYRILDWCEANHADVFLQQMWGQVAWNSHDGVHPLISSPKSVKDFAAGIATLLKYLTETRKYNCIKYFCMVNEPPGGSWGYWWCSGSHVGPSITDAWKALNEKFKSENISIPISGPDWVSLPPCEPEKMPFEQYLGSFDIHSYFGIYTKKDGGQIVSDWVKFAASKNKPFFITEIGNMNLGFGADHPGPKTFNAALSNASDIALGMNLGVDGFNRWSFTNRGDMDAQWQLVKTYDIATKTYIKNIIPENEAYYGYAMITRFMGKYVSVLSSKSDQKLDSIVTVAYKNRDSSVSVLIVNNRKEAVTMNLFMANINKKQAFYLYQITESLVNSVGFKLDPATIYKNSDKLKSIVVLPKSITVLTTNGLKQADFGIID
jgi:hypothetical protein